MSEQEGGGGGKVAVGLFAALGLGGLRFADNCASVGARTMNSVDNVAIGGSRTAGGIDDAARAGSGAPVRGAVGGQPGVRPLLAAGDEGLHIEPLGEIAVDVGLELVSYEFESDFAAPDTFVEVVERPMFIDLTRDPWAWARLAGTGEGAEQAPWIFVGRARGESLLVDDEPVPIGELAATCWRLGTTCVFVACQSDCALPTQHTFASMRPKKPMQVESYVLEFLDDRLATSPTPAFVVIAGGERERTLTMIRPPIPTP